MTLFQRISAVLIFTLLLLYEIYWMYTSAPIIPFPISLYVLFFFVTLIVVLMGDNIFHKNAVFYSFVALELLTIFFAYENSLMFSFSSKYLFFSIPLPLLLFLFSYNFSIKTKEGVLPVIAMIMSSVLSVVYLVNRKNSNIGLIDLLSTDSGSYAILYLIPFILCLKNKIMRGGFLLLSMITVLLSFKRGGAICLFSGLFVYALFCTLWERNLLKKSKRFIQALLLLTLAVFVLLYINGSFDGFLFNRFAMIEERGGSGRDVIYVHVVEMIKGSSFFELLVGHGYNTVLRDNYQGFSAHNDFLECIYDYGLITFFAYISLYINLIRLSISMLMRKSFFAPPLAASTVMFFANSLVSHIFLYEWFFAIFALFWGYVVACDEKEKLSNFSSNVTRI